MNRVLGSLVFVFSLFLSLNISLGEDCIVVIFDTSGSMGEKMRTVRKTRMAVAQDALIDVLGSIDDNHKLGLLTFNGWAYDLAKVDKTVLQQAIVACKPSGGTPLYEAIKKGATRLLEERQKNANIGVYKLIVVTDGAATDAGLNDDGKFKNGSIKPGVLKDVIGRGIQVDTIALEISGTHALKDQINGIYMKGDDPESLKKSLSRAVAEIGVGGNDKLTEDAFREIAGLPEEFVTASLKSLTEFRNYPIGEPPPVKVIDESGAIKQASEDAIAENSPKMGATGGVILCVGGVSIFFMLWIVVEHIRGS